MGLTEEERRKIYEEEKVRARARQDAQSKEFGIGLVVVLILAVVGWGYFSEWLAPDGAESQSKPPSVVASDFRWTYRRPYFTGTAVVTNSGSTPIARVSLTVKFKDTVRQNTVGWNVLSYDLSDNPLLPGKKRRFEIRVSAPDLPKYLISNYLTLDAVRGEIDAAGYKPND